MAEFFPLASPSDVRAERYNPGFSEATLDGCALDSDGSVIILDGRTSGTVTEDISVSSLAEWYKYYRKTTEPTNTSVSCAIKDTEDNILIASVVDGNSLSAIDATTYKTIRVVHTLTRNSTSDDTPKLHYREVSWLGEGERGVNWANKTFVTSAPATSHNSYTHLDITGSGYLVALSGTSFTMSIDGGDIHKIYIGSSTCASLFPIRFHKSLLLKGASAPSDEKSAWVVLD
jgi:hypothetical protein